MKQTYKSSKKSSVPLIQKFSFPIFRPFFCCFFLFFLVYRYLFCTFVHASCEFFFLIMEKPSLNNSFFCSVLFIRKQKLICKKNGKKEEIFRFLVARKMEKGALWAGFYFVHLNAYAICLNLLHDKKSDLVFPISASNNNKQQTTAKKSCELWWKIQECHQCPSVFTSITYKYSMFELWHLKE